MSSVKGLISLSTFLVNLLQTKNFRIINSLEIKIISLRAKNREQLGYIYSGFAWLIFVIVLLSFCQVFSFLFPFSLTIANYFSLTIPFVFVNEINTGWSTTELNSSMVGAN